MRDHFGEAAFTVAGIVFTVVGIWLIANSLKRIFQGDYDLLDNQGNIIEPDDIAELEALDDDLDKLADAVQQEEESGL